MGFQVILKSDPECKLDPVLTTSELENKHKHCPGLPACLALALPQPAAG